jgi:dihydrofolate reductase
MRRFKLQVQTTLDGYMGGPEGEIDWAVAPWSPDVNDYVEALMASVDTIVLGRRLAEGFIPAWAARPEGESEAAIDWMNDTPKVVISDSLTESPWEGVTVRGGDLAQIVGDLKAEAGGDLIAYGGGTLVRSLIAAGPLDELHLFVNPTAIGEGIPVFGRGSHQQLRLVAATPFECGMTALHLVPKREASASAKGRDGRHLVRPISSISRSTSGTTRSEVHASGSSRLAR